MMRLIKNGEPVFHRECSDVNAKDTIMKGKTLHDFSVDVIMEEYQSAGMHVSKIDNIIGNEADFKLCNKGNSVNVKVFCKDDFNLNEYDLSWMIKEYHDNGTYPRIIIADYWCVSDVSEDGKPAVFGGDFCFIYKTISIIPEQCNTEHEYLTDFQIAQKFKSAWDNLDINEIEPFIDVRIHYGSKWVFDELPSKIEYIDYLQGKFNTIRSSNNYPVATLGVNSKRQYALLLNQNGSQLQLEFSIRDGYITDAFMTEQDDTYINVDTQCDLYMAHGDHIESILPMDEFVGGKLQEIICASKVHCKCHVNIKIDNEIEENTDVRSLRYGNGDLSLLSLIAYSKTHEHNIYISTYPFMKGYPTLVRIEKVIEWDNLVEATVFASFNDFRFAFFASDYYINKKEYIPGKSIIVDLAALGMKVEERQITFMFNGEDAAKWYKKIGEEVSFDANGNVSPVHFDVEKLVAYLPLNPKAPDEALFQSPTTMLSSYLGFCDRAFASAQIIIHEFDNEQKLNVPLFFQNDPDDNINRGVPLGGYLWLTGYINGRHNVDSFNICPKIAANFVDIFNYSFMYLDKSLMYVLDFLPDLKIKEGYIFNYFSSGNEYGKSVKGYCHLRGSNERYVPFDQNGKLIPYRDSLRIEDILNREATNTIPSTLSYFKVPFTESGIMQAWILNNIEEFLPCSGNANYNNKHFIFDESIIDELFPTSTEGEASVCRRNALCRDEIRSLDSFSLLPIIKIRGNIAFLEYAYWSEWKGLVKILMKVCKENDSVSFQNSEEHILVKYDCGIRF